MKRKPIAATALPVPDTKTLYPPPFAAQVAGREKRKLGDFFGLRNFGVNLTRLAPGAASALLHCHSRQDEFIYVLEGRPTLVFGDQEHLLSPGDCFGFPAGAGIAHQLGPVNTNDTTALLPQNGPGKARGEKFGHSK